LLGASECPHSNLRGWRARQFRHVSLPSPIQQQCGDFQAQEEEDDSIHRGLSNDRRGRGRRGQPRTSHIDHARRYMTSLSLSLFSPLSRLSFLCFFCFPHTHTHTPHTTHLLCFYIAMKLLCFFYFFRQLFLLNEGTQLLHVLSLPSFLIHTFLSFPFPPLNNQRDNFFSPPSLFRRAKNKRPFQKQ